ncbi:MAG TPA: hypothetical protein VFY39_04045, partial [Gammaproteobacteria bacterium]|nr:hypothetical protein [Gammaproteobacteria bacterium]
PQLSSEEIPVRRKLGDWFLLRSGVTVRRRLFGVPERPENVITPQIKADRLASPAQEVIRDAAMAQLEAMVDKLAGDLPEQLVRGYAERFEQDLQAQLQRAQEKANQHFEELVGRLRDAEEAHDSLNALSTNLSAVSSSLYTLSERFSQTDPATLTQQAG